MSRHWMWIVLVALACVACQGREPAPVDEQHGQQLVLSVETPASLDWGGTGILRLTLANEGGAPIEGAVVEVHLPAWLEYGPVEPIGTEVTLLSGDTDNRLSYRMTDVLRPAERRVIVQHVRVPYEPPATAPVNDTVPTLQLPPANRVVRARLVTLTGEPVGAEVQATLNFVGAAAALPPPAVVPPDTIVPGDTASTRGTAPARPDTVTTTTGGLAHR